MTREEAIECLNYQNEKFFGGQSEALEMAISALSAEGEYIKKEDALDKIVEQLPQRAYMKYQKAIDSLPTYSFPEREKGEWIKHPTFHEDFDCWVCNKCGEEISGHENKTNFCPNCGADMRGDT